MDINMYSDIQDLYGWLKLRMSVRNQVGKYGIRDNPMVTKTKHFVSKHSTTTKKLITLFFLTIKAAIILLTNKKKRKCVQFALCSMRPLVFSHSQLLCENLQLSHP